MRPVAVSAPRFGDADPTDWPGRGPASYPVHGIDISRWQGVVDWPAARANGVGFAYLKATEGGDTLDPLFRTNWAAAARAGVPRGAYHYFYSAVRPSSRPDGSSGMCPGQGAPCPRFWTWNGRPSRPPARAGRTLLR